jgi:hypothetical protein
MLYQDRGDLAAQFLQLLKGFLTQNLPVILIAVDNSLVGLVGDDERLHIGE